MAQSICPKGWHLPTGGSDNASNEFYNLLGTNGAYIGASNAATAFTKIRAVPYLFPATGFVERGLLYADGSGGLYWSSAAYSDTAAYHLRFYSSNFIPGTDGDDRSLGFSVRCVADPAIIWENNGENQVRLDSGLKRMQDITKTNFTEKYCTRSQDSIVAVGATVQLQDARDGETYTIVKLPDGHCWMQQNLRLGSTSAMDLKPSDTNITGNWTLPAAVTTWKTGDNTVVQTRIGNTSLSGWQAGWGNYYSWCAATAGTCSESTANNVNVSGSICPKGWHLPSGGSTDATGDDVGANSELYKLANELNMNTIVALPYLFPAASGISESYGSLRDAGTSGHYWSRTSSDSAYAYFLSFSSGRYPYFNASRAGAGWNRYFGFSVRCLADY